MHLVFVVLLLLAIPWLRPVARVFFFLVGVATTAALVAAIVVAAGGHG